MLRINLKTPGIPFQLLNGQVVRTPFIIDIPEKDRILFEARIRYSAVTDYTIEEIENKNEKPSKTPRRPSALKKPNSSNINLRLNISNPTNLK